MGLFRKGKGDLTRKQEQKDNEWLVDRGRRPSHSALQTLSSPLSILKHVSVLVAQRGGNMEILKVKRASGRGKELPQPWNVLLCGVENVASRGKAG